MKFLNALQKSRNLEALAAGEFLGCYFLNFSESGLSILKSQFLWPRASILIPQIFSTNSVSSTMSDNLNNSRVSFKAAQTFYHILWQRFVVLYRTFERVMSFYPISGLLKWKANQNNHVIIIICFIFCVSKMCWSRFWLLFSIPWKTNLCDRMLTKNRYHRECY